MVTFTIEHVRAEDYAKRGYLPDGRGACQEQRPLKQGEKITVDHDLILWLTKDLTRLSSAPGEPERKGNV
jgi:hypothetical protein